MLLKSIDDWEEDLSNSLIRVKDEFDDRGCKSDSESEDDCDEKYREAVGDEVDEDEDDIAILCTDFDTWFLLPLMDPLGPLTKESSIII